MKRLIAFLLILPFAAIAEPDIRSQMLISEIQKLESELAQKTAKLHSCQKDKKIFMWTGIGTISLTGILTIVNINQHSRQKGLDSDIDAANEKIMQNLDMEKFSRNARQKLNEPELKRVQELSNMDLDDPKVILEISDADKNLLNTVGKILDESQTTNVSQNAHDSDKQELLTNPEWRRKFKSLCTEYNGRILEDEKRDFSQTHYVIVTKCVFNGNVNNSNDIKICYIMGEKLGYMLGFGGTNTEVFCSY